MSRPVPSKKPKAVTDSNFIYTPSHNIYWKKLMHLPAGMEGLAFSDHQTEEHKGGWRNQFKRTRSTTGEALTAGGKTISTSLPLHVEVGCNAGHVVLEWAKQNPDQLYIGIDWKFKQVYRLAEKIHHNDLKNLVAFRANADRLPFMFAPKEIDFLHMFFPDPWPKKAQKKNRTANAAWLRSIAPLLSDQGVFHLKTDHAEYFDFILENLSELKDVFEPIESTRDLHAGNASAHLLKIPAVTLFERLFIKDGLPIHSIKLRAIRAVRS